MRAKYPAAVKPPLRQVASNFGRCPKNESGRRHGAKLRAVSKSARAIGVAHGHLSFSPFFRVATVAKEHA
jgi:hypothetical protein